MAEAPQALGSMFLRAERSGLKLAIVVRTAALVAVAAWVVATRADDATRAFGYTVLFAVLVALGLIHYALIAGRFDRNWVKYLFVALDIAIVSALIATRPLFPTAADLPAVTMFRAPMFPFYFVILGIWALSFSPGVVVWTGVVGALGWMGAYLYAASDGPPNLNWTDIPSNPNAEQVLRVLLDPHFGGLSGHIQESVSLILVALLISVVMWRARNTLRRQLKAERDHAALTGLFGRFVPHAVVDAMIAGRGALAPIEREATVLYSDIAGFTAMTERIGAARTVAVLNAYFDEVTRIVGDHDGIVTQFHGDAVLATFNVPVADPEHAAHALSAARAILALVEARDFDGERLRVRIGINTGSLLAGNVGGGGRQSYTVYGGTVNLAARLEALCKDHGKSLLVSAATAAALPDAGLVSVGSIDVRGLAEPVPVFSLAS